MNKFIYMFFLVAWAICILLFLFICYLKLRDSVKKGKIKVWLNKRKEKKQKKKLAKDTTKKQIKKHNKKKDAINFDALKFEYEWIYTIVNEVAAKENKGSFSISEVYLIKFDEYYKKKNSYSDEFSGEYSLVTLSCLIKALLAEPLFKEKNAIRINQKILDSLVEAFAQKGITYNGGEIFMMLDGENLRNHMQYCFRLYGDDVFLVALYLIEKIDNEKICE